MKVHSAGAGGRRMSGGGAHGKEVHGSEVRASWALLCAPWAPRMQFPQNRNSVGSPTQSAPAKVQTVQGSGGGRWRLSLSRQGRAFLRSHVSTFQLEVIVFPGTAQFCSAVARFFLRACWSHRWKFPSNRRMNCRASLPRGSAQGGILSPIPSQRLYLDLKIIGEEANAIKTIQPGGNSG